ncbi:hypothetical protein HU200_055823 [Digitaria exilis]|uniref:Uncharacterized protein n=1 Tax=Digitaria exilis TaxID=1010633 RepID=A0A835AMW7_9POAL|nr:hypothetical protein HU200_055823 [Digitaria exilis]
MSSTPPKQRHLYLVLDDWEEGYTIRKIDVETFHVAGVDAMDDHPVVAALPDPPVIRVEAAEHGQQAATFFTSLGTKILALPRSSSATGVPVFDTATLALTVAPHQSDALFRPTFFSVSGDRTYVLDGTITAGELRRRFQVLRAPAPPGRKLWSWNTVPSPPPFNPTSIVCHALHPDARTVFFSVDGAGTFSFNTQRLEWTCHGAWLLPFTGQAHYDAHLDAWVGICGEPDGAGHVCSCAVVAAGRGRRTPAPEWKIGAERLFCDDEKRHVGAALVYVGDSRFCLLECVKPKPKPAAGKTTTKKV